MIEAGLVTWCLLIGLNAIVLGFLSLKDRWKEHQYFFAYLAYRFVRSFVIFPIFFAGNMPLYSRIYWATDPLLLLLQVLALGELVPKKWFFAPAAVTAGCAQAILVLTKNNAAVTVEGLSWIFCTCIAALAMIRGVNLLAAGFLIANFFPAISGRMEVLLHGEGLRMVPVFSLAAAYSLWIVWARGLQKETEISPYL